MLACNVGQSIQFALLPYADLDNQCIQEYKYQGRCGTFISYRWWEALFIFVKCIQVKDILKM